MFEQRKISYNKSHFELKINFLHAKVIICTLHLKSLLPLASVWSKTTLNTGGVGGAGSVRILKLEKW